MNHPFTTPYQDSPGLVKTVAVLTLINGIVNIFWGLVATASVIPTIVLACLAVFTILPTILGIFEIIYALKLLSNPPQPVQPSNSIAILEILCFLTGNVFSMIVGILSLVFYNDPQVKEYFMRLNGMPVTGTATAPVPPAPPVALTPAPMFETGIPAQPILEEPTEPKKGRKRKVAGKDKTPDQSE